MVAYSDNVARAHNYKMVVGGKAIFMAQNSREEFGEVFNLLLHANFDDQLPFRIVIETDNGRFETVLSDYVVAEAKETNFATSKHNTMRHTLEIVPIEGLVGTFFKYEITKAIADTGLFDYFGADYQIIPRREYGPEFFAGMGDIL